MNSNNLKLIITTYLNNLELEQKYDYITILGTAEYAEKLGFKNLEDMLKWAKQYLNNNGKILLALDNKIGVKYLAGSTRNTDEVPFTNYKPYIEKKYKLYTKYELEEMLQKISDINYRFYYPVPNYKLTDAIYTDSYLPEKFNYNLYYKDDEEIMYSELTFLNNVVSNKQFNMFTNSYLVEITNKANCINEDINFIKYSNIRKNKYKIITKICKENVTKEAYYLNETSHIEKIKENIKTLNDLGFNTCEKEIDGKITSNYIKLCTLDNYLKNIAKENNLIELESQIDKWYIYLKEKLKYENNNNKNDIFTKYDIEISDEEKNKLTIVENGFIDLIFQNIFYNNEKEEYIIFDQEWKEENVPLEFIMYRTLKQLFDEDIKIKNKEEFKDILYKKYNIINFINLFETIENKWQEEITDSSIYDFYADKWKCIISVEGIKLKYNKQLSKLYEEKDELIKEKNQLIDEKTKLIDEVEKYKKSSFRRWIELLNRKEK